MALKIRLARGGAKKRPFYSIVIADSRSPRDGRFLERVGTYNPMLDKGHNDRLVMKTERIQHWLSKGAQPTERVARFFGDAGLMPKPAIRETPSKSTPKAKAQERAKAAAAATTAAAGGKLTAPAMAAGDRVCVGVITGAHGVAGLVRVKSFTAAPEAIAAYGPLEDVAGRAVRLELVGMAKGVVIARIAGIADRDAAERLRGGMLYLPRAALPPPEDEEYYHADLIGLAVELSDGSAFGRVAAIHAYGAGDSIEVARDGAPPVLVPFTRAAVPVVDIPGRRLVIDPPDGLLAPPPGERPDSA